MNRIRQCDGCPNDGRCQYQDLNDCQCCEQELMQDYYADQDRQLDGETI